jgi:hypothetical protein
MTMLELVVLAALKLFVPSALIGDGEAVALPGAIEERDHPVAEEV